MKRQVRQAGGSVFDMAISLGLEADILYRLETPELEWQFTPYFSTKLNAYAGNILFCNASNTCSTGLSAGRIAPGFGGGVLADYPLGGVAYLRADMGLDYYLDTCVMGTGLDGNGYQSCAGDPSYSDDRAFLTIPGLAFKARVSLALKF